MGLLTKYFILTYVVSWTCFISGAVVSHGILEISPVLIVLQQAVLYLGVFAPSLVAWRLTARTGRPEQTKELLNRIVKWQVNIKWYFFAALFMVGIKISVALLHKIITGVWPAFGKEAWYIMLVAIFFSTWVQAGEEIGWRGFALPRMSARWGLPLSTILLGIIWACWHLPLFFLKGSSTFGQSFPLYLLQVMAASVVMGWLYWRTRGSLLLVMLMHAANNNTKDIVPSAVQGATQVFALSNSLAAWLTVAMLWVFATFCLIRMRSVKILE